MTRTAPVKTEAVKTIRLILLITVVSGMIGLEAELFLLGHIKPLLQLVPVLLIAFGLGAIAWHRISPGSRTMKLFQATMALCIASGFIGIVVHLAFSASEATKKDKTLHGITLFRVALTGVAPPFAPAAMIQIGLVGLAYAFRHPALDGEGNN